MAVFIQNAKSDLSGIANFINGFIAVYRQYAPFEFLLLFRRLVALFNRNFYLVPAGAELARV